ncbi:MAG: hypothetical protein OEW21_00440 [Betaproteobacteria bacterium]|nr:hypothetical protein [Betaproteobacteria bacterium]
MKKLLTILIAAMFAATSFGAIAQGAAATDTPKAEKKAKGEKKAKAKAKAKKAEDKKQ